jgi:hypothetical protein
MRSTRRTRERGSTSRARSRRGASSTSALAVAALGVDRTVAEGAADERTGARAGFGLRAPSGSTERRSGGVTAVSSAAPPAAGCSEAAGSGTAVAVPGAAADACDASSSTGGAGALGGIELGVVEPDADIFETLIVTPRADKARTVAAATNAEL